MRPSLATRLLTAEVVARLMALADVDPSRVVNDFRAPQAVAALREAEVIISCWGCPPLSHSVLANAPRLRAVIHAAGSVKRHVTTACWQRGIQVSSATWANTVPVDEYVLAAILFANKQFLQIRDDQRLSRPPVNWRTTYRDLGNYRRVIGLVGASRISLRVIEFLRLHDFELLLFDPCVPPVQEPALGTRTVELDELCMRSDVVSVHAPDLPATRHMIDRHHLSLMCDGATLINTVGGSLVDPDALTAELRRGRLHAVLDLTVPEVLPTDSPLYDLSHVLLAPQVAGLLGSGLHRMAEAALNELDRYTDGLPFAHPIRQQDLVRIP
ncbi:hydroxyacid dehydrogenase [Streptomyces decoyicus]|uniref:hydroxyacid dehydrogenase n=1 Tax=Streptomyces decoyicus TaxID=249567 RepID=UPI0036621429